MPLYNHQTLKIYNSLSGQKEVFTPIHEGRVGLYVCGPTVYSNVHLGNVRTFMSFDMIYRYLLHLGYKVRYVRNITDAGHLTDDDSEDKISAKARLEQLEPMEIVQKYTVDFHEILRRYNFLPPSIEPTATGHIVEQIEIIKTIIDNGFAYEKDGSVYFDVLKYNETQNYGILSNRNVEDLIANTRELAGQSQKKNPQDFALWKKAEPEHIMRWPSPWGVGFPGWHLECSVMSSKYLGETFDIHGGGMDLKFPHHECEIAQCTAAHGKSPVNYWMHANMLTLNGKKMSKSTGNNILPAELFTGDNANLTKGYSPSVVRFFILQANYRSILDFSDTALQAAEKGFEKLMTAISLIPSLTSSKTSDIEAEKWKQSCYDAMNDDFNSPVLIAHLFEAVKYINGSHHGSVKLTQKDIDILKSSIYAFCFEVLGLEFIQDEAIDNTSQDALIQLLIDLRNQARANKNFQQSDEIRDRLLKMKIQLKDTPDGTTYESIA